MGFYAELIQRYVSAFSAEQVKILFLSDLEDEPGRVMSEVFKFIGVETPCAIDYSMRNKALSVVGNKIYKNIAQTAPLIKLLLKPLGKSFRKQLGRQLHNSIQKYFGENKKEDQIPIDLRRKLIDIYEPHTATLERMAGRSLEDWRK